ncbi:MAG: PIG-L family deacetylase [Chloroflexota bacterium]
MSDLSILASYAHPDDEQGASGTLRMCLDQGMRVGLLCATRGEVGEIADPSLATPETLGQVREQELRTAMNILGVPNVYFLDYRDSGMDGTSENKDPRAFINADETEAVGKIVKVIRSFKPTVIVTFDVTGGYGHPDHIAIHRWTTKAFHAANDPTLYPEAGAAFAPSRLFYASIPRSARIRMAKIFDEMGIHSVFKNLPADKFGLPDELITNRVNVKQYVALKKQSLSAHKTQLDPNGIFAKLPEETWDQWRSVETFAFAEGVPLPPDAAPDDLFAGLH